MDKKLIILLGILILAFATVFYLILVQLKKLATESASNCFFLPNVFLLRQESVAIKLMSLALLLRQPNPTIMSQQRKI